MFYDRFTESVSRFPDLIAVELQRESSLESYTFTQLRTMAESVGNWLLKSGISRGSKCAFLAANHPWWVAAYLGVVASGNTAVPLDTAFHADQVHKHPLHSLAREATHDLPVRLVLIDSPSGEEGLTTLAQIFADGPDDFQPVAVTADDISTLLYTSGTTSAPKSGT